MANVPVRFRTQSEILAFLARNQNAQGNVQVRDLADAFYSSWANVLNVTAAGVQAGNVAAAYANTMKLNALIGDISASGGGRIYLPAGTYYVSGTGTPSEGCILLRDNVFLYGDSRTTTTIECVDMEDVDVTGVVRTPSGVENSNIIVADLTIDGGAQTGDGSVVCFYAGVTPDDPAKDTNITLMRVAATRGYDGAGSSGYGFDPHEVVERLAFIDCYAFNNDRDGFVIDGCQEFSLIGCHSFDNGRHGYNFVTGSNNGQVLGCFGNANPSSDLH